VADSYSGVYSTVNYMALANTTTPLQWCPPRRAVDRHTGVRRCDRLHSSLPAFIRTGKLICCIVYYYYCIISDMRDDNNKADCKLVRQVSGSVKIEQATIHLKRC